MEGVKTKILIVEDDTFMIDLLVRALQQRDFNVTVAKSAKEAIENFKTFLPEIILLDISLPDQTGLDALREIRQLPDGPKTKVLVLSNLDTITTIEEAKRLGALDYLVKVRVTLPEIVEKINSILEK